MRWSPWMLDDLANVTATCVRGEDHSYEAVNRTYGYGSGCLVESFAPPCTVKEFGAPRPPPAPPPPPRPPPPRQPPSAPPNSIRSERPSQLPSQTLVSSRSSGETSSLCYRAVGRAAIFRCRCLICGWWSAHCLHHRGNRATFKTTSLYSSQSQVAEQIRSAARSLCQCSGLLSECKLLR